MSELHREKSAKENGPAYYSGDFFSQLPVEKRVFVSTSTLRKLTKHEFIYIYSDIARSVFYLISGRIKTSKITDDGKETIFFIHRPGSLLGISAAMYGNRRLLNAVAITACELYQMDITTFHELLQKHPSLSKRVFEMLVKRISYLTEHYVAAMHDSSITRLKTCLAYLYFEQLIDMKDNDLKQSAPLSIHQGEIASHIGFSRQMTNQLLGKLSQEGTIRIYRNTIVFLNARSLLNTIEI